MSITADSQVRNGRDATQYDLCLDSSKLGYEKCIEEIENQLKLLK